MKSINSEHIVKQSCQDICEQLDRDFNSHGFYGLEYIINDLMVENVTKARLELKEDWFGLFDLG